jgi:hypothetical protein
MRQGITLKPSLWKQLTAEGIKKSTAHGRMGTDDPP